MSGSERSTRSPGCAAPIRAPREAAFSCEEKGWLPTRLTRTASSALEVPEVRGDVLEHGLVEVVEGTGPSARRDHAEDAGEGLAVDRAVEPEPAATGSDRDAGHPVADLLREHLLPLSPDRLGLQEISPYRTR